MSAISLKSITGITSITTPAGVDNQLTLHNNNTTEAVKLDIAGNLHFHNHLNITGVSTASNFKTGTSNVHSTGFECTNVNATGVITATSFSGGLPITNGANNRIITASSASAIQGEANLTFDGANQLKMAGSGQQDLIIGSTNAGGSYLILDGDSNGDAVGADYAYIAHDTGGDVIIGGDNPSGDAAIIFKAGNNAEKVRIASNGRVQIANNGDLYIVGSSYNSTLNGNILSFDRPGYSYIQNSHNSGSLNFRVTASNTIALRLDNAAQAIFPQGVILLGTQNTSSGHINAYENMSFNIDSDNDDTNRYFSFHKNGMNASGTELFRIQEDGKVFIGTDAPGSSGVDDLVIYRNGNGGITLRNNANQNGNIFFSRATSGTGEYEGYIQYQHAQDRMVFGTNHNERLRLAGDGKIYVKGNGGDVDTNFSDAGTFFNLKHDTYGGRIGFSNGTASAGVTIAEVLGYWGSNKVAGWIMTAGGDTTNRDDGEMSFYTRESGQGMFERLHIGSEGEVVAGYRVGTSSVRSNQPVAFHSTNVTPHGNARRVSTGQRCNLFVGSNSGWSSGDGGVIAMGGSETGGAGVEATWAYVTGKRQSGNGWEYGGYFEVGTSPYSGTVMAKRMRLWANGQMEVYPNDDTFYSTSIGGAQRMVFKHNGGGAIEIKNNNGNMTFTSSSDYRLKKDEVAISNALSTVKALKPYQFTWKTDGKLGQGFFAHEAQAVLPDIGVVSGTKDEVHTNDETENGGQYKKDDPIYQGIDYSKLVPLLTAALQEETAKREALEARVAALEGS